MEHSVSSTTRAGARVRRSRTCRRRTGVVGLGNDFGRTLRMGKDGDARIILTQSSDFGGCEAFMHLAMARPGDDFHMRLGGDILRQVFVRQHDDFGNAQGFDDLLALPEVQQMSDSAFTAAEELT